MNTIRPITSPGELERKRKKNAQIIGIVMGLILLVSTAGYAFMSFEGGSTNNKTNPGIRETGNGWIVPFQGQEFLLSMPLDNQTEINMYATAIDYYNQPIYISSNSSAVVSELTRVLGTMSNRVQEACYGNCTRDLPEKGCSDNLIVWTASSSNKITQNEKCVFIDGDLRAVDAFLYRILGY